MKKHLLALAALATVSGAAFAQSATVYGILDLSVVSQNHQGQATSANGRTTSLNDAVWMPSVFGITGSEDLGGGLKASFNLESDINADTGKLSDASTAGNSATAARTLFGRKSNIALSGNFGEIKVGKDIDMIFLQGFIDNIRNSHSASGFVANAIANNNSFNTDAVFIQNMVRYTTPSYNGLKASVQHRFGETAGNAGGNNSNAYLVNYANGGLTLNVGHKSINDRMTIGGTSNVAGSDQKLTYVGATYSFDKFKVATTYHKATNSGVTASTADTKTYELGASYAVSPALTAAVNYVKSEINTANADAKNTSFSLKYAMSKRTSVWGLVSHVRNQASNTDVARAVYSNADTVTGTNTTALALGMTHSF